MKLTERIARLFDYTKALEETNRSLGCEIAGLDQALAEMAGLRARIAEEREGFAAGAGHERERAAAAEARAALLEEELARRDRWIDTLSNQNFELTDRLCLIARVPPTSEPLRHGPQPENDTEKVGELFVQAQRRTGPVASRRQQVGAAYVEAKNSIVTEDRKPPPHLAPKNLAAVDAS